MVLIKSTQYLIENWDWFIKNERKLRSITTYSVMLYTTYDKTIIKYMRENWNTLHIDTGDSLHLFVFEKPVISDDDKEKAKKLWTDIIKLGTANPQIRGKETIPYDATQCTIIGDEFQIPSTYFPCLVFFNKIDVEQILVAPFDREWNEDELRIEFEKIISDVKSARWKTEKWLRLEGLEIEHLSDEMYATMRDRLWLELEKNVKKRNRRVRFDTITRPLIGPIKGIFETLGDKLIERAVGGTTSP
ncbi:MAG: hypothetical protein RTU30_09375 [Candidatus Thorarchaeota archaeon]